MRKRAVVEFDGPRRADEIDLDLGPPQLKSIFAKIGS
jgi:hypothetical protein